MSLEGQVYIAEWSSSVARRAHNPKVVGSNPAPATINLLVGTHSGPYFFISTYPCGTISGQNWDKRDGGFCPKLGRAPSMTSGTPGTAAREMGSVSKAVPALRQNRRPSVLTLLDSRAGGGKKGFFSPESGTVGTDAPGFPRSPTAHLPMLLDSRASLGQSHRRRMGKDACRRPLPKPMPAQLLEVVLPEVLS